jgi:hypothetical protein
MRQLAIFRWMYATPSGDSDARSGGFAPAERSCYARCSASDVRALAAPGAHIWSDVHRARRRALHLMKHDLPVDLRGAVPSWVACRRERGRMARDMAG